VVGVWTVVGVGLSSVVVGLWAVVVVVFPQRPRHVPSSASQPGAPGRATSAQPWEHADRSAAVRQRLRHARTSPEQVLN
jgi:hypothetical protein